MKVRHPKAVIGLVKRYAKLASKLTGVPLCVHHEQFAAALGFQSWHHLTTWSKHLAALLQSSGNRLSTPSLSEVLPPRDSDAIPFRFRVGQVTWQVQASPHGPLLSKESSGSDRARSIYLGLVPVIVQRPSGLFAVTRYADDAIFELESYSSEEVFEFGRLAGIPVWPEASPWSRVRHQQEESQLTFLRSPAFAAVRRWLRAGGHARVKPRDWIYGLPSLIWTTLVAMSDHDFAFHGASVAEAMLSKRYVVWDEREEVWDRICERWAALSPDGKALDIPFAKLFGPTMRGRLANG